MRIDYDVKLDFDDVLLVPKRSSLDSRKDVQLERTIKFPYYQKTWTGIPIMSSNMISVSTWESAEVLSKNKMMTVMPKFVPIAEWAMKRDLDWNNILPSIGIHDEDIENLKHIFSVNPYVQGVVIDAPNGYLRRFEDFVKRVRDRFPDILLVAGNVATPNIVESLILNGVDCCKLGVGSGAQCLTRQVAGVGVPQFSCICEGSDSAHGLQGHVVSDGGIRYPADLMKSFGAGADFVMIGSAFSGHYENSPMVMIRNKNSGDIVDTYQREKISPDLLDHDEEFVVPSYGMSSKAAQENHMGGMKDYRASEGREVLVPYRGGLQETINDFLGGIRSGMTYIGARKLKDIPKCSTFIRVGRQLNTWLV